MKEIESLFVLIDRLNEGEDFLVDLCFDRDRLLVSIVYDVRGKKEIFSQIGIERRHLFAGESYTFSASNLPYLISGLRAEARAKMAERADNRRKSRGR